MGSLPVILLLLLALALTYTLSGPAPKPIAFERGEPLTPDEKPASALVPPH